VKDKGEYRGGAYPRNTLWWWCAIVHANLHPSAAHNQVVYCLSVTLQPS